MTSGFSDSICRVLQRPDDGGRPLLARLCMLVLILTVFGGCRATKEASAPLSQPSSEEEVFESAPPSARIEEETLAPPAVPVTPPPEAAPSVSSPGAGPVTTVPSPSPTGDEQSEAIRSGTRRPLSSPGAAPPQSAPPQSTLSQ